MYKVLNILDFKKIKLLYNLIKSILFSRISFSLLERLKLLNYVLKRVVLLGGRLEKLLYLINELDNDTKDLALFSLKYLPNSYSADFQDIISLYYSTKINKDIYSFLEIGAANGVRKSNCFLHELIGWHGVCIEPNPTSFRDLKKNRSSICLQRAYSSVTTEILLSWVEGQESQGSVVTEQKLPDSKQIKVETIDAKGLLEFYPNGEIDYVSIDTEGLEDKIIKNLLPDFNISVISVEINDDIEKLKRIDNYLRDDYKVMYDFLTRNDLVYIKNDLLM